MYTTGQQLDTERPRDPTREKNSTFTCTLRKEGSISRERTPAAVAFIPSYIGIGGDVCDDRVAIRELQQFVCQSGFEPGN